MAKQGVVSAVCISQRKGVPKEPTGVIRLVKDYGVEKDAHAGTIRRQVSLLCQASADKLKAEGLDPRAGIFAENMRVSGLTAEDLALGTQLRLERGPMLEVTQIGKECHSGCAIAQQVGRCVMPTEGIFARVVEAGEVRPGDTIAIVKPSVRADEQGDQ